MIDLNRPGKTPVNISIIKNALKSGTRIQAAPIFPNKKIAPVVPTGGLRAVKLPDSKTLKKRWSKFERHNSLYESIIEAYCHFGRILTSQDFRQGKSKFYDANTVATLLTDALTAKNEDFFYLEIKDKTIQTRIELEDLTFDLNMTADPQVLMDGEDILSKIFGGKYKTPKQWQRVSSQDGGGFTSNKISIGEDITVTIPLEKIVGLRIKYKSQETNPKKLSSEPFALESDFFDSKFNGIAALKLTLKLSDVSIGRVAYSSVTSGDLKDLHSPISIAVEAEAQLDWPIEFALYVTCCEKSTDFIPFIFYQYITWHRVAYGGGKGRGGGYAARPPSRISNFGNVIARNDREKAQGRNPSLRVNEDGFTILGVGEPSKTGEVYWIPNNVNRVQEYIEQIKKAHNSSDNKMELYNVKLKGEGLYTDSFNDKFTYFRESGTTGTGAADISGIQTIDLTGSTPLDRITIYTNISQDLRSSGVNSGSELLANFMSQLRKFAGGEWRDAKPAQNYSSRDFLTTQGFPKTLDFNGTLTDFIIKKINSHNEEVTWANIGGYPLNAIYNGELVSESNKEDSDKFTVIRACLNVIKAISQDFLQKFDRAEVGFINKLDHLRFYLYLITKYSGYMDQDPLHPQKWGLLKQNSEAIKANSTSPISDEAFRQISQNIKAPNLPNLRSMMPHQIETAYYTQAVPTASLTEVSPGGGKTPISTREVCELLFKKTIKRALFVVPGNLVRNWINEIYFFSGGKMNGFALTIQSLRRLQYVYTKNADPTAKPDYKMLAKILEELPPNTIIVTSYNFLSVDRETIVYGNEIILRLYAAEFLRDMPCDFVGIDESHYAKNLKSNRTLGVSIVESAAKIKRALSGTTVNDSIDDLIGQAGTMVPVALGSESRFNSRYMTSSGAIKGDAINLITQDMKPHIQRIVHKRQKWAHLLPKLSEQFHPVEMTTKQAEFYKQLLEGAIDEIKKKNPKLAAKMMDGGDETDRDNNSIEKGLGMYFQSVEQFIYAPDSNEAFIQLEDLEPEDLVSPKIAMLVDILNNHFNGYTDTAGNAVEADNNKVIIFSHRKKTSEHIMAHLPEKYKKIAVRYVAGDFKALQAFLLNNSIKIIVADEISINTGQNFQLASRMIRLETLWSPGDQEQALARIWRPDFKSGNDRKRIFLDWIFTDGSLEVCKIGRLISKIVVKMKYDQQDNPHFTKHIFKPNANFIKQRGNIIPQVTKNLSVDEMLSGSTLKLVKMNTKNMLTFNRRVLLQEYFSIYALANHWEDSEFERLKNDTRYNKVIDLPQSAYVEIEGSKVTPFIPRIPGVEPATIDPKNKMGYKPISVIENEQSLSDDDDDDSGFQEEVNPVSLNEIVDTEFGIGEVTKLLDKEIWVNIRGLGEIKVPKATAWIITNPKALERVKALMAQQGKRGIVRLPPVVATTLRISSTQTETLPVDVSLDAFDTPQPTKQPRFDDFEDDDESEEGVLLQYEIVDGQIALVGAVDDVGSNVKILESFGFKSMPPYTSFEVKNVQGFDRLVEVLSEHYQIRDQYLSNIQFYRKFLQRQNLNEVTTEALRSVEKFFTVEQARSLKEGYLRPYPIVWGHRFFIAVDRRSTKNMAKLISTIKSAGIPGLRVQSHSDVMIKFYKNAQLATDEVQEINDRLPIDELGKILNGLKTVRRAAAPKPVVEEKKPVNKIFNPRLRKLVEEQEEEEERPTKTRNPIFKPRLQLPKTTPKPAVKVVKPVVKKPEPAKKESSTVKPLKPIFKFNLKGGKVR